MMKQNGTMLFIYCYVGISNVILCVIQQRDLQPQNRDISCCVKMYCLERLMTEQSVFFHSSLVVFTNSDLSYLVI